MTREASQRIADGLLRPLADTSWRFYVLVAVLGGIVLMGAVAWITQASYGFGVTGIRWPVFWGFYVTNFVFWIGISHAGTLISAILRLVNARWRRPVTRSAEAITVFALMIGAMFPDHSPRTAVALLLAGSISERTTDLAELPIAARLGFLRHHHVSHRQLALSDPADDSRFRADSRSLVRMAAQNLRHGSGWAGRGRPSSGIVSNRRCRSWPS